MLDHRRDLHNLVVSGALQVQMQMGGAAPFQPYGPNYFNLPPAGSVERQYYPSMDPSAMGTKIPAPGQPPKRSAEPADESDALSRGGKRAREDDRPPMQAIQQMPYAMPPPPGGFRMMPPGTGTPVQMPGPPGPVGAPPVAVPVPGQWPILPVMQRGGQGLGPRPMVPMPPPPPHPHAPPRPMAPRAPRGPPQRIAGGS